MSADADLPLENLEICHENQRKRLGNAKKHRYRRFFKGNGCLSKTFVVEGSREEYENIVKRTNRKGEWADDISRGVIYSQGKKKRWLLRDSLVKETPEPKDDLTSVSVVRFDRQRAGQFHCKWLYEWANHSDFRDGLHKSNIRSVSVRTKDGQTTQKGNFQKHLSFVPTNSDKETRVHLEYQVLDFCDNYKIHDSYGLRPYYSDWNLNSDPEVEGFILSKDVVRDADGSWITGYRERPAGIFKDRTSLDASNPDLSENQDETETHCRKDLTLGDFMPHFPLPTKLRRPRALSESWDYLVP